MRKRFESLWAIRPEAALTVVRLLARDTAPGHDAQVGSGRVQLVGTQWEATKPSVQGNGPRKVAVIPIQGVLTNDGPSYYGSNYKTISDAAEKAAADPDVKHIVLSVDSPGGEVTGLPECAAVLAQVSKIKPLHAMVEGASASAAYWLTSQATDVTLTPSGEVGSVGVRMMHVDMSKMLDAEGYKVTEMHSGDFKTEWSPYKPLSAQAQADMQKRLDASHQDFLSAIARGRGGRVSQALRASRYGEGRMHSAKEALAGGLVDKVQAAREFYQVFATPASSGGNLGSPRRARLELQRLKVQG